MALTFDPQQTLGGAAQGAIGLPVVIGLPSAVNPIPNFIIGASTTERARTASQISGFPITDGDLVMKSARASGRFTFDLILSETPNVKNQQVLQISKAVQQISNVASSLFGGGLPNLTGASTNPVASQLATLRNMKDGFQPIFALNLFMPLAVFSTNSGFLSSSWYIEDMSFAKDEAERGVIATLTLKELLQKRGGVGSILENLANELLGPGVGSAVGGAW